MTGFTTPDPEESKRLLVAAAARRGLTLLGVAEPGPLVHAPAFRAWLQRGFQGEMAWLARDPGLRLEPERFLSGVRAVVSVALSYAPEPSRPRQPAPAAASSPPRGRIARYARGADYHNVLGRRLRGLLKELRGVIPGLEGRWSVDAGPVMDRAWAARGGLGWWGKHTNLVSRQEGSWLLLGTLFLSVDLPPDPPETDHCGSCRRCMDVCPTRAIVAERVLDARLCISYLTIELRGSIPVELRPLIGDWIFGCDLCLEVCPWNRFARAAGEARFRATEDRDAPALLPLLELDEAEFRRRFNGSPVQRARRDGFVRNVTVALGNVGGPEAVAPLRRAAASDVSPLVREHALWALTRLAERGVEVVS